MKIHPLVSNQMLIQKYYKYKKWYSSRDKFNFIQSEMYRRIINRNSILYKDKNNELLKTFLTSKYDFCAEELFAVIRWIDNNFDRIKEIEGFLDSIKILHESEFAEGCKYGDIIMYVGKPNPFSTYILANGQLLKEENEKEAF